MCGRPDLRTIFAPANRPPGKPASIGVRGFRLLMYAVIKSGGKQYKVAAESTLRVEKLPGDVGASVDLTEVLMVVDGDRVEVGRPILEGVKVEAEITAHGRGPKLRIVKFRRRKHYRKQMGHRQDFTEITVRSVCLAGPPPAGLIPRGL